MARWRLYGIIRGSKDLGVVEAATEDEAKKKGWGLDTRYVSLCHQCADECEDPEMTEIVAEEEVTE